ncbi:hypothetical protein B0H17DRAFT_1140030 [Mycena rosella]|uniref:Uncharacterized protein n=1 Tax=Mycena rosella TaxID=1033263 RepID=A0AAD7G893_MYCRO|nr:hypothetical protein B0H17DRAFT_1140030 [Mycena rosella]
MHLLPPTRGGKSEWSLHQVQIGSHASRSSLVSLKADSYSDEVSRVNSAAVEIGTENNCPNIVNRLSDLFSILIMPKLGYYRRATKLVSPRVLPGRDAYAPRSPPGSNDVPASFQRSGLGAIFCPSLRGTRSLLDKAGWPLPHPRNSYADHPSQIVLLFTTSGHLLWEPYHCRVTTGVPSPSCTRRWTIPLRDPDRFRQEFVFAGSVPVGLEQFGTKDTKGQEGDARAAGMSVVRGDMDPRVHVPVGGREVIGKKPPSWLVAARARSPPEAPLRALVPCHRGEVSKILVKREAVGGGGGACALRDGACVVRWEPRFYGS